MKREDNNTNEGKFTKELVKLIGAVVLLIAVTVGMIYLFAH